MRRTCSDLSFCFFFRVMALTGIRERPWVFQRCGAHEIRALTQTPKPSTVAHLRSERNPKGDSLPRGQLHLAPDPAGGTFGPHGQIRRDLQDAGCPEPQDRRFAAPAE